MAYREIISKAVISKGKKVFSQEGKITVSNLPSTVLGCWVINHKYSALKQNDKIIIDGSYDVNIWYSYDNDTKTDVVKESHSYSEIVKMHSVETNYDNLNIIIRSLTDPKCVSVKTDGDTINYQVDLELGIELVGDVKVKIAVDDNLDDYEQIIEESNLDKEIDESVNTDYLEKE